MSQQILNNTDVSLQARFEELARRWKEDTALISSSNVIATHPAYLEVIKLGAPVVPLILRDMAREQTHWFVALSAITGEDPIPRQHWGRIDLMVQDWLAWGRDRGLFGAHDPNAASP